MMKNDLINELLLKMTHNKQWAAHPALPSILASLPNLTSIEIAPSLEDPFASTPVRTVFSSTQSIFAPGLRAHRQAPGLLNILSTFRGLKKSAMGVIMVPLYPVVLLGQTTEMLEIGSEFGGKRKRG